MARRWRDCNIASPEPFGKNDDEDLWRDKTLEILSKAHTIGGIVDFTLETGESNYSVGALLFFCSGSKHPYFDFSSSLFHWHRISPWYSSVNHLNGDGRHASRDIDFPLRLYPSILFCRSSA